MQQLVVHRKKSIDYLGAIEAIEQARDAYEAALDEPCNCMNRVISINEIDCPSCAEAIRGGRLITKALELLGADMP